MRQKQLIPRPAYLRKLAAFSEKDLIKIVTGIRRCGKSTLLILYQQQLLERGVEQNRILNINLEDYDLYELRDPAALHRYVTAHLTDEEITYVFIDEVQLCKSFPDVINSLRLRNNIDLYVTGSNASMLSGDLATYIAGRYVEIPMLPLSFREYLDGTGHVGSLSEAYSQYTGSSSFPFVLQFKDQPKEIREYLQSIYDTIVARDIMARYRFANPLTMERVLRFVFDSIGNRISMRKIADTLSSAGHKTDVKTVERYMSAFQESYLVYRAGRYDVRGREHLRTLEKYYAADPGLRRMMAGPRSWDDGSVLENIVFLELLRRGAEVYTGKWKDREIDFVAMKPGSIEYYQVAASVRDPNTLSRELFPLQAISDNYPKTLLTLDDDPEDDINGIRRINALDWLAQGDLLPSRH